MKKQCHKFVYVYISLGSQGSSSYGSFKFVNCGWSRYRFHYLKAENKFIADKTKKAKRSTYRIKFWVKWEDTDRPVQPISLQSIIPFGKSKGKFRINSLQPSHHLLDWNILLLGVSSAYIQSPFSILVAFADTWKLIIHGAKDL